MFTALWALVFAAQASTPVRVVPKVYPPYWDSFFTRFDNNCYNYATNRNTGDFAQPGATAGLSPQYTCAEVLNAAAQDRGVVPTDFFPYKGKDDETLIALVVWPKNDFHWYRRGDDGKWTHKPGRTQVSKLDNSGREIDSPETADRGPYTEFCGYFKITNHQTAAKDQEQNGGEVQIRGPATPLALPRAERDLYSGRANPEVPLSELRDAVPVNSVAEPRLGDRGVLVFGADGSVTHWLVPRL